MGFGIRELKGLLGDYTPDTFENGRGGSKLSVIMLAAAADPLDSDTIYVAAEPDDLSRVFEGECFCAVACFPRDSVSLDLSELSIAKNLDLVFLSSSPAPEEIFSIISAALKEDSLLAQYSKDLLVLLFHGGTVQMMVDLAFEYMKRTICVFDTGYRLIAATWDHPNSEENAERIFENKFLDTDDIARMNLDNLHERVKKSPVPLLVRSKKIKGERIVSMINNRKDVGHFIIFAEDHPFEKIDLKFAELLRNSLDQQMKKDEFVQHAKGFNYEWFLKDILDGKRLMASSSNKHLTHLDKEFSKPIYCLVVEIARTPGAVSIDHVRSGFEALLPGVSTVVYSGQVVAVFSKKNKSFLKEEDVVRIERFCIENDLFCGMSNYFNSITDLPDYYNQALRAIQVGAGESSVSGLFVYTKHFVKHVASVFLQKENADTFCCPQMKQLIEYDKAKGKDLAKTLYMYLLCGNAYLAASAMFIHRNTMLYRMGLINELVSVDYKDPKLRQYLILSYEMMTAE